MKEFLAYLVKALVDHPGSVRIASLEGEHTAIFELRCEKEDVGKIIGKRGNTISALRTLLSAFAARNGRKIILEIVD